MPKSIKLGTPWKGVTEFLDLKKAFDDALRQRQWEMEKIRMQQAENNTQRQFSRENALLTSGYLKPSAGARGGWNLVPQERKPFGPTDPGTGLPASSVTYDEWGNPVQGTYANPKPVGGSSNIFDLINGIDTGGGTSGGGGKSKVSSAEEQALIEILKKLSDEMGE